MMTYELSKEHMAESYDVFLQLQEVVTPVLRLHTLRSPHKNKPTRLDDVTSSLHNKNILSLNQLQTKHNRIHVQHLSYFMFCVHVHKSYLGRTKNKKIKKSHLGGTEGYPISNFKDSVTMTWNAWHAFMTPAGFCPDLSGSLWVEKSAGDPQEGIYMLNTASSGRAHWTDFTLGGRRPFQKVMSLVKANLLRGGWS